MLNTDWATRLEEASAKFVDREMAWMSNDRRGRWLVLEAGTGSLLRGQPAHIRQIADAVSDRRARRFSSLSRARAFAKQVGGTVHHWRRTSPRGGKWQRLSPWQWTLRRVPATGRLYGMVKGPP